MLFNSPMAREETCRPVFFAASLNCCYTSGLRRRISSAAVPRLTCTPSRPISLATSNAPGSPILPMDQSHAPSLKRRLSAAANNGAQLAANASQAVVWTDCRIISRRETSIWSFRIISHRCVPQLIHLTAPTSQAQFVELQQAISLTPWLQPGDRRGYGGQAVSTASRLGQQTVETVQTPRPRPSTGLKPR